MTILTYACNYCLCGDAWYTKIILNLTQMMTETCHSLKHQNLSHFISTPNPLKSQDSLSMTISAFLYYLIQLTKIHASEVIIFNYLLKSILIHQTHPLETRNTTECEYVYKIQKQQAT